MLTIAISAHLCSDNFNLIGCRKLEAVGGALQLGYDVVFSDMDIALIHDPIKHLFFEGVDYVHSQNEGEQQHNPSTASLILPYF